MYLGIYHGRICFAGAHCDANGLPLRVVALYAADLVRGTCQKSRQGHQSEHDKFKSLPIICVILIDVRYKRQVTIARFVLIY